MVTVVTKTIGTAGGRDYSTMQSWEDAAPANLVTSDQVWLGECYLDSTFTTTLTISGSTSDSTRYKHLTAAAGQSFIDTGAALRFNTANGASINNSTNYVDAVSIVEANVRFTKLQVKFTRPSGGVLFANAANVLIDQCIFENLGNNRFQTRGGVVSNTLIYKGGVQLTGTNTLTMVNCTVVGAGSGTGINSYNATARNVACFNYSTPISKTGGGTHQTNYADASTSESGWTGGLAYSTATFVNISTNTEDFKLVSGSALLNVGTTDSTNAPVDIFGTSRPQGSSYDVGCFEYIAAASGIARVLRLNQSVNRASTY